MSRAGRKEGRSDFQERVNDQFIAVATAVGDQFPNLDLRFARETDDTTFIMQAVGVSDELFEFELGEDDVTTIVNEAILALKVLTRSFDD